MVDIIDISGIGDVLGDPWEAAKEPLLEAGLTPEEASVALAEFRETWGPILTRGFEGSVATPDVGLTPGQADAVAECIRNVSGTLMEYHNGVVLELVPHIVGLIGRCILNLRLQDDTPGA